MLLHFIRLFINNAYIYLAISRQLHRHLHLCCQNLSQLKLICPKIRIGLCRQVDSWMIVIPSYKITISKNHPHFKTSSFVISCALGCLRSLPYS